MKKSIGRIFLLCILLTWLCCTCASAQIDVQSTLFDPSQFTARICVTPDRQPVYIILDQLTIGGVPFDHTGGDISDMWTGYPHASKEHSLTCEFFVLLEEGYVQPSAEDRSAAFERLSNALAQEAEIEISFRITLLAPTQSIQSVDISFAGDSTDAWRQIDGIVARGDTPVDSEQPYTVLVASDGLSSIRTDEPVAFPLGSAEALIQHANMEIAEQETFSFLL